MKTRKLLKKGTGRRILSWVLCAAALAASVCFPGAAGEVRADSGDVPYVALGADLSESERAEVLNLLGLTEEDLANYTVAEVTNEEEHQYLGAYLSAEVIGSRALSSVVVRKQSSGSGIQVTTKNITYCTVGMYQNALATAGIKDADIIVAGPFNLSGTAALVGAMKAYANMSGKPLEAENIETATNELVATSQLGESIGNQEKAEELIGAVKDVIVSEEIKDPEKMKEVISDTATKLEITLTDEQIQQILDLMKKISELDLDVEQLQKQLQGLYDKLESLNIDLNISTEQVNGILGQLSNWFSNVWEQLQGFFSNLFSGG